jgi:alpha-D-xyloside xylohydrolase
MKRKSILVTTLLVASSVIAWAAPLGDNSRSVTIQLNQQIQQSAARIVRLTVISPEIIRVQASPDAQLKDRQSLIIVKQSASQVAYQKSETASQVILTTSALKVTVDKKTGRLAFYDVKTGKTLLQESEQGGKSFTKYVSSQTAVPLAQRTGYSWHTQFDSPADEAFYGLGQHQAEEMNYKGKNEELFQYNTKVSIPFVVSTKNYGLLWDSYSYGRWGNPNDYQQLQRAFTLYNKDGKQGSLTGTYTDKSGTTSVRDEDSLYFENSRTVVNLPKMQLEGSHVVYEGSIEAPTSSNYHFILYYAGYVKMYLNGKLVVPERWRTAWNPNAYKFVVPMKKGERVPLRIEWQPDGSVSYCGLRAAVPQTDEQQNKLSIWSEMTPDMDYYFIGGKNMDEVISGYRQLTGQAQVMPKWALGFWQSRERYKTSSDIEQTLGEFRKRHIPIDNIVQDWNYWKDDQWGSHQFDETRYPDPQAMLDSVHQMHGRFMISVWPKLYCNTDNYKELDAHGWMYQQAVKDSIHDWIGYVGSFYDAYAADARKMFWRQMNDNLYTKYHEGIDAWWMDASEPNVRDCTPIDYRKDLCGPTALGTSDEYFNAYSIVNADAIYNGQRAVDPDKRVFLLTRSGFAGLQRYSTATWSGDIGTRWEDMRAQMTAGLNFSMAGVPFWGMDQGGFCVEKRYVAAQQLFDRTGQENEDLKEWRELQTRWNQFGCFIPLYRTHGQWPLREVWNIAPDNHPAYQSILYYDRLRYQLMPYLYSMTGWVHFHDYTMLRGLAMDFAADSKVLNIGNQWMFGPALMACPVGYYKARQRDVYFPKQCGWYDLYTGKHIQGGQTMSVDAPYERIPVFVREGAIIPFGPAMEWSDQKPAELINLYVYAGADGKFQLYEDEGTNYNYEKGKYATIDITYNDKQHSVTIGDRKGQFSGMLQNRRFNVVLITPSQSRTLDLNQPQGKMVKYSGKKITIKLI